jgi:hypothetical protein
MKNLHEPALVADVKARLARLQPDSPRQWGRMTPAQAVAHLSISFDAALGDVTPPRMLIGRFIGALIKPTMVGSDKPMQQGAPTVPTFVVADDRDLDTERARLSTLLDRFVDGGAAACTTKPHAFFGRMTPDQWSVLMYKHLDHHLRQFGV